MFSIKGASFKIQRLKRFSPLQIGENLPDAILVKINKKRKLGGYVTIIFCFAGGSISNHVLSSSTDMRNSVLLAHNNVKV